ncbi:MULTISPECIES: glycosyltransferase family 4 protein [unclassified Alcanivorax]|uniref:glycosyltransferase family 4 protein n=1 Tax=unclassified Alcanivorax TaxID=2638842 RepID=UPI001E2EB98F|nr:MULTISPECIES: glycosyltransferase family 4 protein [unclassified Alcanivorax]
MLQVLPALNSGGVERGTVEFARELVLRGHDSWVLSQGGGMVEQLEAQGSRHVTMPVHRKSLFSLKLVRPLRRLLQELAPDVVHVRSRLPAWLVWLAWRKLDPSQRPVLVSTFHGLYSVNRYSAIMAKPEKLIAVSEHVGRYMQESYSLDPARITVIPRGVDTQAFSPGEPDARWLQQLFASYPHFKGKRLLLMPGRLSRWKGQETFLDVIKQVVERVPDVHGVIVGGAEPNKQHYRTELENKALAMGLGPHVTLVGRRSDLVQFYRLAEITCHLSSKPEPFGRVITEALASGCKVVGYDCGGAGEILAACFPDGLVATEDTEAVVEKIISLLDQPSTMVLPDEYGLQHQVAATLGVYEQALVEQGRPCDPVTNGGKQ